MIEVFLIVTGLVFAAWLYALVQQTQQRAGGDLGAPLRPVVPLNLRESDEAVLVAEGRGRIIYVNEPARQWFGIDGGAPNLSLMAQRVQPADALHDLLAGTGQASFRLGQRQIEAVSHAIPIPDGSRMVVVMRELTADAVMSYTDYDPLRALSIVSEISQATSKNLELGVMVERIVLALDPAVMFDGAEVTLWTPETETLRPVARTLVRTQTGRVIPAEKTDGIVYRLGEGYTGWIAMYRQPLLINNVGGRTDVMPKNFAGDYQSYLGVPLLIDERFVGTLELTHHQRNAFSQRDVMLLLAVSGQIASSLEAARLYQEQTIRIAELDGLQQISEAMSQLGETADLYGQMTQRIAALMNVDICGVLLYDEDEQTFRSQPPFYGAPDSLVRDYRLAVIPGSQMHDIWHYQPWWFTNEPESPVIQAMGFDDLRSAITIANLAIAPMIVGARRIGLLLAMNTQHDGFDEDDMRRLISYATQAAVVAENARLYADEQRRNRELGGLQQIAQAMGVLRTPAALIERVTRQIAELMDVEMCGILLYDAVDRVLVSQEPFYGLEDPESVRYYQLPSPPGSPVAALWRDRETWFANNIRRDPLASETALAVLAPQMGMQKTAIATLLSGDNRFGIIQVANKRDRSDFTQDDIRVLSIFAGQAAVLIDNARLYREMQRRTHEAEGLRAITEIVSAVMPNYETIEQVMVAIANLLESDRVVIALVDDETGQLVISPDHMWSVVPLDEEPRKVRIDAYSPGFENSVLVSRRSFFSNNLHHDPRVLEQYKPLYTYLRLERCVQVPLVIRDRCMGELMVANRPGEMYGDADVALLQAIATQVSAMFDRLRLYQTTDQDLHQRIQELNALSRVSHELSRTLELERILDVIRQEALRSTQAAAASIVLLEDRSEWLAPDQPVIEQRFGEGRSLRALTSIELIAVQRNDVLMVDDYKFSEYDPKPPSARSALVVPITLDEVVVGVLHLYSPEPGVFDQRTVDFAVSLTDQATVALGNARRYREQIILNERLRARADQMSRIFSLGEMFRQGASLEETLEEVAHGVQETIGFNVVLISLADERAGVMRRTAQAGLEPAVFDELRRTTTSLEQTRGLMQEQYRVSNSFFLPVEGAGALTSVLPVYHSGQERVGTGPRAWDPDDLLIVPLYGTGAQLLGMISVDEPRSGRRPDTNTIEALEIFANQAAFSIENYMLVSRIRDEADATRRERDRLAQLHMVASEIQAAEDVPARLQVVANGIHDAGWGHVLITLRDEHLDPTALIQAGYYGDEALTLSENIASGEVWRAWINDLEFHERKLGAGYYLRYDDPWVRQHVLKGQPVDPPAVGPDEWHPQDVLYLPLVGQQQQRIIGIITMNMPTDGRVPTLDSLQPFELFASQAAAAIETTRLYQETQRAADQEQRINEVMEAVSAAISPPDVLKAVGHGLQQMVPFTRMSTALYNEETGQFDVLRADIALDSTVTIVEDEPVDMENTALARVYNAGKSYLYQLAHEPEARAKLKDLAAWYASGERSTLVVPMIAGGQVIGALHLGSELENAFGFQETTELIQRLANLSAVAMDNARLFEQATARATVLDAQARRLGMLNLISTRLVEALAPQEIYEIALHELQYALGAHYSGLVLYESETTGRLVAGTREGDADRSNVAIDLSGNPLVVSHVRETHKPVASSDVLNDERFEVTWETLRQRGTVSLLVVPLIIADEVIGTIGLDFVTPHEFIPAELELAETIASQVSVALEKANLLVQTEQRARELNAQAHRLGVLSRMAGRLAATLNVNEVYTIVLENIQQALAIDYGGLMIVDLVKNESRLVLSTHPADDPLPDLSMPLEGNPIAQYVLATHQPFICENIPEDPRFEAMWEIQKARNTAAMMIVPVILSDRVIGTIGLDSARPRVFTEAEIDLAVTAANQAAVAIEKGRLFTEAQMRAIELDAQAKRMARVNQISTRLAQTLDLNEIYSIVLHELQDALNVAYCGLLLFENDEVARLVADTHPTDDLIGERTIPLKGNRSIEIVRETQRALMSPNVLEDPVFEPAWTALRERGTRSLIIAPLSAGDEVVGTIGLDATDERIFTEAEIELVETMANQASLAIEKARLYNETLGLTIFNQAVVESIQQGIVVLDENLKVRRINRFMVERYNWDNDALGKSLFEYRTDYAHFLREPMAVALAMGEPQVQYEVERRDESGLPSIRNYYVYPMREGRQVTGVVLLLEDVTERARLEADLEERAVQMAALTEVSGQITATLEPDQVISLILDALGRVLEYDGVALWLRVENAEELVIAAARGYADPDATGVKELLGLTVEIPYSPLFREMSEKAQAINIGDVGAGDPRFPHGAAAIYKNWLGAPLISRGEVVGVIALEKREPYYYNSLHEQLATTFANQAAVALYNAQLFEETRARAQELDEQARRLALLNRVSLALAQTLDLENIFEIALRETAIALGVSEGSAMQIDPASNLGMVIVNYPRGDAPPNFTFDLNRNDAISRVRQTLIPLMIENSASDPLVTELHKLVRREDITRSMLVPLVVGGMVIGVLRLDETKSDRHFTEAQVGLAQTIASQAGIAVQNAALFEQTAIRTRELETLFESAQATAVTLDLDEVVRRVTVQMLSALGTDACAIYLWDDVNNQLIVRGEISARSGDMGADQIGDVYNLSDYPLRERALRDRELITVRVDDEGVPDGEHRLMLNHEAATRVLIPLVVNDISIGLVEVELLDPTRYFKPENVRLARTLASQAAISIENARLQTETRRTVEELYIINDMSTSLSSANNLEQLLDVIDFQLPNLTEAQWIYVVLYDTETGLLSFPLALSVLEDERYTLEPRPLGKDEFSFVVRRNAPLLLAGDNIDEVRRTLGLDSLMPEARCFLGVPLTVGDEVIGVLAVRDDSDPTAFTHNDQRILTTIGGQLGVATLSTRLFQQTLQLAEELDRRVQERTAELEQERQHISTLYNITTELATSLDMERMLDRALGMVARAVGASHGAILSIDPLSERLEFRARLGWDLPNGDDGEIVLTMHDGLTGWAIENHESLIVNDVQRDSRWLRVSPVDDVAHAVMVSLIETNEDILGVMILYSEQPGKFTNDHLMLVTASSNQVATAMNNAELYSLIRDQAERLGEMLRQEQVEAAQSASIMDSVADGVMVVDARGTVIVFNTAASRILRLPVDRVLGRSTSQVTGLYGGGSAEWAKRIDQWMNEPTGYETGEFHEEQLILDDGRTINVRLSPVNMGEQFLGTVSVFRDITREVEVDRLKSEFVATVSHELRTPMTSIKGYADLLLLGAAGEVTEQQQRFLETIKQNADRLSVLVNDLLDISRIDQGRMEIRTSRIEVDDLIHTIALHVRSRADDEQRTMTVNTVLPEDQHLTIWGDYDKVAQIMTNLADNAFNYTPAGGTITFSASYDDTKDHVILQVQDTGVGIPPSAAERVFERFFRGDELQDAVMDTPGTGLGLAIVKELVKAHNGAIWFESEVDQGTTFYVSLPSSASAAGEIDGGNKAAVA